MSSKIIKLTVQNLLRIQAAEVTPDGALVIVAGKNDQGKSSLLNCIAIALSGKNLPAEPIRAGATNGHVILETEQFVITRKFSMTGGGQLMVLDREGKPVTAPQTKLDALYSLTTFDPLTFTRQEPKAQAETLRRLTGLDFTELQRQHEAVFSARTQIGREVATQKGRLAGVARNPDAPAEPVDVSELSRELQLAIEANAEMNLTSGRLSDLNDDIDSAADAVAAAQQELTRAHEWHRKLSLERDHLKEVITNQQPFDTEALTVKLSEAQATNAAVKENARWREEHAALLKLETEYAEHTATLASLKAEKDKRTSEAAFPIEGLAFDEAGAGVMFNGHPFQQVSSSQQIRVSLAIACALNPNLRVMLIRDGSLLDADSLALVRDYAEKHEAQVFLECVGEREDATVIIEDGTVIATPAATAKKKAAKK